MGIAFIPLVLIAAMMHARCCDDHTALCAHVESFTETDHVLQCQFLCIFEDIMLAATASRCRDRGRKDIVFIHKVAKIINKIG